MPRPTCLSLASIPDWLGSSPPTERLGSRMGLFGGGVAADSVRGCLSVTRPDRDGHEGVAVLAAGRGGGLPVKVHGRPRERLGIPAGHYLPGPRLGDGVAPEMTEVSEAATRSVGQSITPHPSSRCRTRTVPTELTSATIAIKRRTESAVSQAARFARAHSSFEGLVASTATVSGTWPRGTAKRINRVRVTALLRHRERQL
jgi:ribosomal protein L31E